MIGTKVGSLSALSSMLLLPAFAVAQVPAAALASSEALPSRGPGILGGPRPPICR